MSGEIVVEEERELRLRKVTIRETVTTKTKTITIQEFEQPTDKQPIIKSLEFEPVTYVSRRTHPSEESYEAISIDDLECRKELAQIVGLPTVPEKRSNAFNELYGIFDEIVEAEEEVNVTEWVKSLRRRV